MHVKILIMRPWGAAGVRSLGLARRAALVIVDILAVSGGLWEPGQAQAAVAGKTYDLWVSAAPGMAAPPGHTCVRFTTTTIQVDACGPEAGPLSEVPLPLEPPVDPPQAATTWSGHVPCGGLAVEFNGGALDGLALGLQANVLSAVAVSGPGRLALGVAGVENPACQ
jgi:hypothetical protein